jgi:hypothetical protein
MTIPTHARVVLILTMACQAVLAQRYQALASPVPARVTSIVGDFDGDGLRDLLDMTPAYYKGDGNGNFSPRQVMALTGVPPQNPPSFSAAVADFDANGYDDVVIRSTNTSLNAYAFGPGGALQVPVPAGANLGGAGLNDALYRLVAADLDSNGFPDLVVTSLAPAANPFAAGVPSQPRAFKNLGGGSLVSFSMPSLTTAATHTFVVDADADGRLDIVVLQDPAVFAVTPSAPIVVIRQGAPGSFNSVVASNVALASFWSDAAMGDVDGDGLPDLYVSRQGVSTLFLNAGGGTFAAAPGSPGLTSAATQVEVRLLDLNQNGDAELVTIENAEHIEVHDFVSGSFVGPLQILGPALETFGPAATVPRATPTAADVDLDGRIDLVCFTTGVMLNDGHGGLSQVIDRLGLGLDSGVHRLADVNGDGFPDILAVRRQRLSVGLNDGAGRWNLAAANVPLLPPVTTDSNSYTQPFDFDGDGDLDLYFANTSSSGSSQPGLDVLLRNDGNLTWSSLFTRPSYRDTIATLPVDLDGDQDQDLVMVRSSTSLPPLVALINFGTTLAPVTIWQPNATIRGCAAFDMENDGDPDLFVPTFGTNIFPPVVLTTVLVNSGTALTPLAGFPQVSGSRPAAADFDGDGLTDLLAGGTVIRNAGGGNFTATEIWTPAPNVVPRAVADVDRDGDIDLVLSLSSELRVYVNDGIGGFNLAETMPFAGVEYPTLPVAMDVDRDGDVEIDYHLFDVSHQLARTTHPRIARPLSLRLNAPPGTAFGLYVSLGRSELALPPYGTVFLDLGSLTEMAQGVTGATGTADVSFVVPNLPAFAGVSAWWQAIFFDGPHLSGMEPTLVGW